MKDFFVEDILEKFEDYTQPVVQGPSSMDPEPRNKFDGGGLTMDSVRVIQALAILENQPNGEDRLLGLVDDYRVPNVSHKIIRIIHSYTNYVNRVVWKKSI